MAPTGVDPGSDAGLVVEFGNGLPVDEGLGSEGISLTRLSKLKLP